MKNEGIPKDARPIYRGTRHAVGESFFATLKVEIVHEAQLVTREQAQREIFEYIEGFYNRVRRHSYLGYVSPVDYEC